LPDSQNTRLLGAPRPANRLECISGWLLFQSSGPHFVAGLSETPRGHRIHHVAAIFTRKSRGQLRVYGRRS
jgi:hypothetical protein